MNISDRGHEHIFIFGGVYVPVLELCYWSSIRARTLLYIPRDLGDGEDVAPKGFVVLLPLVFDDFQQTEDILHDGIVEGGIII